MKSERYQDARPGHRWSRVTVRRDQLLYWIRTYVTSQGMCATDLAKHTGLYRDARRPELVCMADLRALAAVELVRGNGRNPQAWKPV